MKVKACLCLLTVICIFSGCVYADGWVIPNNHENSRRYEYPTCYSSGISVQLLEDLATRSGPSTTYTGCGSYEMKGEYVYALSRAYDNGGVLWVEIEFTYGGGYRRAWTGAKRLNISERQLTFLPEADPYSWLGYGTINSRVKPRFGPGDIYATYSDRDFYEYDQIAVICYENGYYLAECYHTDGNILRCWVPEYSVDF